MERVLFVSDREVIIQLALAGARLIPTDGGVFVIDPDDHTIKLLPPELIVSVE